MADTSPIQHESVSKLNSWQQVVDDMVANMSVAQTLQAALSNLVTFLAKQLNELQLVLNKTLTDRQGKITGNGNDVAAAQAEYSTQQTAGQSAATVVNNNINAISQGGMQTAQDLVKLQAQMANSVLTIPQTTRTQG